MGRHAQGGDASQEPDAKGASGTGITALGNVYLSGQYVAGRDLIIQRIVRTVSVDRPARLLPRDTSDFINRIAEIRELADERETGRFTGGVALIVGKPGVGKTALALRVAHTLEPLYPDGHLYADFGGFGGQRKSWFEVIGYFLNALGIHRSELPTDVTERQGLYRSVVFGRRLLIILDNVAEESEVRSCLPGGITSYCIVTSRSRLTGLESARRIELDVFDRQAAILMLSRAVPSLDNSTEGKSGSQAGTADLLNRLSAVAERCAGLPLALRIAGAQLGRRRQLSIDQIDDWLRHTAVRLLDLRAGDLALRRSFDFSYTHLRDSQKVAFALLSLIGDGQFSVWAVAALCGLGNYDASLILQELADLNLIDEVYTSDGTGWQRYAFHDVLREYSNELLASLDREKRSAAINRLIHAYAKVVSSVQHIYAAGLNWDRSSTDKIHVDLGSTNSIDLKDPVLWCEAEYSNALEVIDLAYSEGLWRLVLNLSGGLYYFFHDRYLWDQGEHALGVASLAAIHIDDKKAEAEILLQRAALYRSQARLEDALKVLKECLVLLSGNEQEEYRRYCLSSMGITYRNLGVWNMASGCFAKTLALAREREDRLAEAFAIRGLGTISQAQEDWSQALVRFKECLALFEEIGDIARAAMAKVRIGAVYRGMSLPRKALVVLDDCRPVFEMVRNSLWLGITAVHQGAAYSDIAEFARAQESLDVALDIFNRIGDSRWKAIERYHRGVLLRCEGKLRPAESALTEALGGFKLCEDRVGIAKVLNEKGRVLYNMSNERDAVASLVAARDIFDALRLSTVKVDGMLEEIRNG